MEGFAGIRRQKSMFMDEEPTWRDVCPKKDEMRSGSSIFGKSDSQENTEIADQILKEMLEVPNTPLTAAFLARKVKRSKHLINIALYALLANEKVVRIPSETAPTWVINKEVFDVQSIETTKKEIEDVQPVTIVLCDLGNVHCCLQHLLPYAQKDILQVRAYADLTYNGFGKDGLQDEKNAFYFHAQTADKNSADLKLIWDVCNLVNHFERERRDVEVQFYVCTKDLQFQTLKNLVEENPRFHLTFCKNWEDLRIFIE